MDETQFPVGPVVPPQAPIIPPQRNNKKIIILFVAALSGVLVISVLASVIYHVQNSRFKQEIVKESAEQTESENLRDSTIKISEHATLLATVPEGETTLVNFDPNGKRVFWHVIKDLDRDRYNTPGNHVKGLNNVFLPEGASIESAVFSPDDSQYAYVDSDPEQGGQFVRLNGKEGKHFTFIYDLAFSRDGRHFAYTASREGSGFIVLDGEEKPTSILLTQKLHFTDGGKLYYITGDGEIAALAGKESPENILNSQLTPKLLMAKYRTLKNLYMSEDPIISNDGLNIAYIVNKNRQYTVFYNDKAFPVRSSDPTKYSFAKDLTLSSDGKHFAYGVTDYSIRPQKGYIVKDGQVINDDYFMVSHPVMSPDGSRLAYNGSRQKAITGQLESFLVLDGKEIPGVAGEDYIFSDDGKHFAYRYDTGKESDGQNVVVDGIVGKNYANIINRHADKEILTADLQFLPGSSVITYVSDLVGFLKPGNKQIAVIGDKESSQYDEIYDRLIRSADGKKISFAARKGTGLYWVEIDVSQ